MIFTPTSTDGFEYFDLEAASSPSTYACSVSFSPFGSTSPIFDSECSANGDSWMMDNFNDATSSVLFDLPDQYIEQQSQWVVQNKESHPVDFMDSESNALYWLSLDDEMSTAPSSLLSTPFSSPPPEAAAVLEFPADMNEPVIVPTHWMTAILPQPESNPEQHMDDCCTSFSHSGCSSPSFLISPPVAGLDVFATDERTRSSSATVRRSPRGRRSETKSSNASNEDDYSEGSSYGGSIIDSEDDDYQLSEDEYSASRLRTKRTKRVPKARHSAPTIRPQRRRRRTTSANCKARPNCPDCPASFTRMADLRRHKKSVHNPQSAETLLAETRPNARRWCLGCSEILARVDARRRHEISCEKYFGAPL